MIMGRTAASLSFKADSHVTLGYGVRPLDILLVEDNEADAELTAIALEKTGIAHRLGRVCHGGEVVSYLTRRIYAGKAPPDLILLDLGLPGEDGFEVLSEIHAMRGSAWSVPVVILTGFEHFDYMKTEGAFYILDYLIKPCDYQALAAILRRIDAGRRAVV